MKYEILVIDPPWPKKKAGKRKSRPNQGKYLDYNTMELDSIASLMDSQILPLANKNNSIFLWTIDEFLFQSEQMMQERGYKKHARLIWNKMNGIAPAFSVRFSHEYLIWFYKPKFMPIDKKCQGKFKTVFEEPSREHSRKPDIAYDMISKMFPLENKIDVFSREKRNGWDQWGNEINFF